MLCTILFLAHFGIGGGVSFPQLTEIKTDLKFEDCFPRRSYFGKSARAMKWSYDDRYLAYLWNPYDDRSFDLWIYDAVEGKHMRITDIEMMANYDRETRRAINRYRTEKQEEERVEKMTDEEQREWDIKKRKEDQERKEPLPSYPGISEIVWANQSNECLLVFRGDIFKWKVGDKELTRMTRTRENEVQVEYTKDDSGFTFRRGDGVFRMKFGSAEVTQLNPELPNNMPLQRYSISPDGTLLMIQTGRQVGAPRQVDYITYRDRFAEARKTARSVADDRFNSESYVYLYDLNDDPKTNPKHDGKPWEIWKWPGGEEFMETSIHDKPWSPDSKLFVFATWKRTQKDLQFIIADIEKRELKTIYKTTHDGEHRTPSLSQPFFTPDGSGVIALLETSGYRHAWLINPMTEGATQITKGNFEAYPLQITKDGKYLFVEACKENFARQDIYKVDIPSGNMQRITTKEGTYGTPAIAHNENRLALTFASWTQPTELFIVEMKNKSETQITDSHRKEFQNVNKIKPQLFTYKNRHGHQIHGYMFLPKEETKSEPQKRPLMIYVYGGPLGVGKSVQDGTFSSTAYLFNMYLTYALGYVTVTIDPRGQSGYGSVFGKANWEAPGVAQTEDLQDAVKFLVENYHVDPQKVAINGWSFGGFQTQMCLFTAPETFTLGIAGAGPTEWQNYNNWYTGGVIGPAQLGKPDVFDKFSLTHLAKNLRSPLLLLHGVEDTNVLFQDTIKVYQALLRYGKGHLVELAIDPTGGHGMGGDMSNRDRHRIYLEFILKHWGIPESKRNP